MKKRIVSIFFVVIMVLNLAACGKNEKPVATVNTLPMGDSTFAYTVIYGEEQAEEVSESVSKIALAVKKNFKKTAKSKQDNKLKASKENLEILVGSTNRTESEKALELVQDNRKNCSKDSIVAVIDNKIVINAFNTEILSQTADWFVNTFLKDESTWAMLKSDYKYIYEYEDVTDYKIGSNSILNYSIIMRQDSSLVYGTYAEELKALIEEKVCYDIPLLTDEDEASQYEILIGKSARNETNVTLSKNQYNISVKGDKLVVVGYDDQSTGFAVRKVIELFKSQENGVIPDDYNITETFTAAEDDYKLVYADEFNTLNKNYWIGYSGRKDSTNQFGKTEHNDGTKNVKIRDGVAILPAWIDTETWETYASSLEWQGNHYWKYGIIEIRAKWGGNSSTNTFWFHSAQGDNEKYQAPGISVEYDIIENFGNAARFNSNLHFWWKDKASSWSRHISLDGTKFASLKKYSLPENETFADKFHTFSCKWSPESIEFAVDGKTYLKYDLTDDWNGFGVEPYSQPIDRMHITNTIGEPSSYNKVLWKEGDPTYCEYQIDYYRIYQRDSDGGFSEVK